MPRTLPPDSIKSRPWRRCVTVKILRKRLYKANPAIKAQLPEKNRVNDLAAEKQYTADLIKAVEAHPEVSAIQGVPEALHSLQEKQEDIQEASRYPSTKMPRLGISQQRPLSSVTKRTLP